MYCGMLHDWWNVFHYFKKVRISSLWIRIIISNGASIDILGLHMFSDGLIGVGFKVFVSSLLKCLILQALVCSILQCLTLPISVLIESKILRYSTFMFESSSFPKDYWIGCWISRLIACCRFYPPVVRCSRFLHLAFSNCSMPPCIHCSCYHLLILLSYSILYFPFAYLVDLAFLQAPLFQLVHLLNCLALLSVEWSTSQLPIVYFDQLLDVRILFFSFVHCSYFHFSFFTLFRYCVLIISIYHFLSRSISR